MRLTLVKIGGGLLESPPLLADVLDAFAHLPGAKLLVHGGGRAATELARRLGIEAPLLQGRRVTSQAMLEVALMVYGGLMSRQLVAALQQRGIDALGLTGADLNLIEAHKRPVKDIDYGFVGDIDQVNAEALTRLLAQGSVPILAPLTHDGQGQLLNTNADTIAATVASALADRFEVELIFAFERPGVLTDPDDDESLVPFLTRPQAEQWQAQGVIAGGMLPKLHNAWQALASGVHRVLIGQAKAGQFSGTELRLD
jgi:acetylglutamate kinase